MSPTHRQICVFCASRPGNKPIYTTAAQSLATALHQRSWGLVYGGGTYGLMGEVAKTLHALGGEVVGMQVRALIRREVSEGEVAVGKVEVLETMHERKARMAVAADAFVALPGGFGTVDELVEIITWSQIGMHAKPIVVFNVDGFFDNFLRMVDGFVEEGFVDADTRGIVKVATTAQEVVEAIEAYVPPKGRMKLDWEQDGTGVSVEEALA